jgi:hypothetical protein
MIFCNATVDVLRQASPASKELSLYRVEVLGKEPNDFVRIYDISAKTQDEAAKEGLDRFVREISALVEGKNDNEEGV